MSNGLKYLVIVVLISLVAFTPKDDFVFEVPNGWPQPKYTFKTNAVTEAKFKLGRQLFYDPVLSADSTISCASCHLQATGFAHTDHTVSHGIQGRIGTRNAPALVNLAWSSSFMWDGGVNHMDVQALAPLTSPDEMGESLKNVVKKLGKSSKYTAMFREAYGSELVTGERILKALSVFNIMLVSSNSKYDKVIQGKEHFTEQEANGYKIFKRNCAVCHTEPLFTNDAFENNGITTDEYYKDYGRMKVTRNLKDSLKFKVPTLRNVEFTYPYMHDGRYKKLIAVMNHYSALDKNSAILSDKLKSMQILSDKDKIDLIVFLKTLTDKEFLYNSQFSFPKK